MNSKLVTARSEPAVYVYEAPVRLWHWVNALSLVVLAVTGYLIAHPLPSMPGEASEHFVMGTVRLFHFSAAYIFAVGWLGRVYWALVGNEQARQLFLPPLNNPGFWDGVMHELKWYTFLTREPRKYTGHNPLAVLIMHVVVLWGSVFMLFTGFALLGEGAGMGSWQYDLFSSWVIPLFGQSQDVHTWHHLGMWLLVCFVMVHIYVAVREDIMSRQTLISSMVSGWRSFRDQRDLDDGH